MAVTCLAFLTDIVSRCDANHSVKRGGPTQCVCGWVCAGPNRSALAWERSVERLTELSPCLVEIALCKVKRSDFSTL